jgi:phosphatidylglycerol lysyltransferase
VRVLAVLLVPWTFALASVDGARWFPAAYVQRGWVVFDVGLAVALFALTPRWRPALATWLAVLITADALLTAIEALSWNASRVRGVEDAWVIVLAIAAPSLAAVVMWNARARRASIARLPATLGCSRVG